MPAVRFGRLAAILAVLPLCAAAIAAGPDITTLQHRARYARDQLERAEADTRKAREDAAAAAKRAAATREKLAEQEREAAAAAKRVEQAQAAERAARRKSDEASKRLDEAWQRQKK